MKMDDRFLTMYHPVVDFSDCSHLVSDSDVLNLIIHSIKKGIKFAPLISYLSSTNSFCYAIKDNRYVIDVEGNVSKCTVVDGDYSIVGKITEDGILVLNDNNKLWLNARISPKCNNCKSFASCGGGACPLYYFKHSVSRCMKYKDEKQKEEILKITELQGAYNLTLSLE